MAGDQPRRERLGEAARRIQRSRFSGDRMADEYAALLESIRTSRKFGALRRRR
jgi:glycosyltransferase involved in cell wall biosynthesis